jgi:penicillin-binding protein 2
MSEHFESPWRYRVFLSGLVLMGVVFFARLAQLQLLYADVYGKKSEQNSIRPIIRDPIRGNMYERNGILVVDSRPSYTVTITPAEYDKKVTDTLAAILNVEPSFILDRVQKGRLYNRFTPTKIKRDIDFAMLSAIEEKLDKLPGVSYQIETKRYYPTNAKAPHLFGYTKEISERLLAELGEEYRPGDIIGATGIEAAYERFLHGQRGFEFIMVNAKGQVIGNYNDGKSDIPVKEGNDIILTLDANLQALAESLLAGRHGAVVAIDPRNGDILALVSKPDYDNMTLSGFTPANVWNALNSDTSHPLFNRATLTRYPPGSTFKMVLAAAALQEGVITTNWRVNCKGAFVYGNKVFKDLHVHGSTNIVEAIQRSCNVFFYQLMLKTGFERWTKYGQEFGFGSKTGIDILEEDPGLLPSAEYFDRVYGKGRWTQGYLISLSIGQGDVGVSPLQMAAYAMALANKGQYFRPHVIQSIVNRETKHAEEFPASSRTLSISGNVWDIIREGMYRCVNEPGGTGGAARVQGISVSGKTGTAENPHGKDHAWFVGYAPADNPKIAICVLVENAGYGGAFAAPIAGLCIEKYLYGDFIRYLPKTIAADTASQMKNRH